MTSLLQRGVSALSGGRASADQVDAALISMVLGMLVVVGGSVVKLPQISALLTSRTATGLPAPVYELENVSLAVFAAYGYLMRLPVTAYGEAVVMLLQNTLLLELVYRFTWPKWPRVGSAVRLGGTAAAVAAVLAGHVGAGHISRAYDYSLVVMAFARLYQIEMNFRTKSTGQLSILTYGLSALGCLARVFTSYQDGGGMLMMKAFAMAAVLNAAIAGQILVYWPKKEVEG